MPTYDYVCDECGGQVELFRHNPDEAPAVMRCSRVWGRDEDGLRYCSGVMRRQIGPGGGVLFKGSGFFTTDYRSESYMKGAGQ